MKATEKGGEQNVPVRGPGKSTKPSGGKTKLKGGRIRGGGAQKTRLERKMW